MNVLGITTISVALLGAALMVPFAKHLASPPETARRRPSTARPLRFINLCFGLWLVATPWILASGQTEGIISTALVGFLLIFLSLPRGRQSGALS